MVISPGYYGFDNAGDEAVLAGLIDAFQAAVPELSIAVASANPGDPRRQHGVDAFHRYRWREFRGAASGMRRLREWWRLALPGCYQPTLHLLLPGNAGPRRALCHRPVMIAQGIGPIISPSSRRATAALFNRAAAITVRDPHPWRRWRRSECAGPGSSRPPIRFSRSGLRPARWARRSWPGMESISTGLASRSPSASGGRAGSAPAATDPNDEHILGIWAEAAAFVHRELGAQVLFVPMHPLTTRATRGAWLNGPRCQPSCSPGHAPPRSDIGGGVRGSRWSRCACTR